MRQLMHDMVARSRQRVMNELRVGGLNEIRHAGIDTLEAASRLSTNDNVIFISVGNSPFRYCTNVDHGIFISRGGHNIYTNSTLL
jgi:hypothetical protein